MDKKKYGIIAICGIILLGIAVYLSKETALKLKDKEVVIEYGEAYAPKIKDLITDEEIKEEDVVIKTTLKNQQDKTYPAVGEYEVKILYKKQALIQKVTIKDTTPPVIQKNKDIIIPYGKKEYLNKDVIPYTDLSVCDVHIDDHSINYEKEGIYKIKVRVSDIYNNEMIETLDVKVEKTIENIKNETFVLVKKYIPNIKVDLRYASTNNFTHKKIYDFNDAYLRAGTVKKLMKVQDELNKHGYSLLIWDGYRPLSAQRTLWDVVSDSRYVANPNNGPGGHNLGNTVDITLITTDGKKVIMPTEFDDFSKKADRDYSDIVSQVAINNSRLLEGIMKSNGFKPYVNEWWHYSDTTAYSYVDFQP